MVNVLANICFFLNINLSITCDTCREVGGQCNCFINALVCSDWVCPNAAAIASIQVRPTLLNGSCSVNDQPKSGNGYAMPVILDSSVELFDNFGPQHTCCAHFGNFHKMIHADSQKNDRRGANASMSIPAATPARRYSKPSASV